MLIPKLIFGVAVGFGSAVLGAYILGSAELRSQWLGWTICSISCFIWIIMGVKDMMPHPEHHRK